MKQLSEETMRAQATRASALGVEVFVVDANWFTGDFPSGVGNWDRADPHRFPNGLEPLAEYVRELGMDFGLCSSRSGPRKAPIFMSSTPNGS